jgi:hypothetical protein
MNKLFGIPIPRQSYAYYIIRGVNNPNLCLSKNRYVNLREVNRNINCVYRNEVSWYRNTNYFTTIINYKHKVLIEEMQITALPRELYNLEYNLEEENDAIHFDITKGFDDHNYDIKLRLSDENKSYDFIENKSLVISRTPFLL